MILLFVMTFGAVKPFATYNDEIRHSKPLSRLTARRPDGDLSVENVFTGKSMLANELFIEILQTSDTTWRASEADGG